MSLKMLLQSTPLTPCTSYCQFPIEPAHVLRTRPFSSWRSVTQCLTFSSEATSSKKLSLNASPAFNASFVTSQGLHLSICLRSTRL